MGAKYKIETDDPQLIKFYLSAPELHAALWELSQKFREWYKYQDREEVPITEIRETFSEILYDKDVNLDRALSIELP